jgi:hypothetical protein
MKFLNTNLTVEDFVASLAKLEKELPKLLNEWSSLDPVLQDEYSDQMSWALNKAAEFIKNHSNKQE